MSKDVKNEAIEFIRQELAKQMSGASFSDSDNLVQFGLSSNYGNANFQPST